MKISFFCLALAGILSSYSAILANNKASQQDTIKTFSIDEVVVIASSKETNKLSTLPGSASILTPNRIASLQVSSIKDISAYIPNLYMPDYGAKLTSAIYIRGVGTRSSGQSIGLYVDNAPYLDKSSFDFELIDIQRIEVLRGPQGTLYGRNAMGGIINIYTLSPLDYQGIKASLSYGNYGRMSVKSSIYTKFNANAGLSAGIYYDRSDGFFTNAYNNKKMDQAESVGGNLKFHWRLSPSLTASYTGSYEYTDEGAFPYGLYDVNTKKTAQVNINDQSAYRRHLLNNNLTFTYRNNAFLLTSVSGYQWIGDDMKMDQDFSEKSIFILNQLQNQHAFTEEISIKCINEHNYQWSFGAYGFYNKLHTKGPVEFKKEGIKTVLQPVFDNLKVQYPQMPTLTISNETLYIPGNFKTPSYGVAAYHQSSINNLFIKGLSITLGIRLDYEKQDFQYNSEAKMNLNMQMSPAMPPTDISNSYAASIIDETLSQEFWQILPKFSLKYECTPRTFTYLSVAKGYKAGGHNVQMSADIMQNQLQYDVMNEFRQRLTGMEIVPPKPIKDVISYKPETSWNYEAGLRSELLKDRLHAELTFFYTDVSDLQITKFVASGSGRYLSNAGKAKSTGAELSLHARLTDDFTPYLNYGYTQATFLNYNNERADFKGKYIPYIPHNTASIGIQYNKPLTYGRFINQITADIQCNGVGRIYWNEQNNLSQPFYTLINAQVGIRKGIVSVNLLAQNLTNTDFSAFYFESFGNPFMQKGKPLQFGMKISISQ